MSMGRAFSAPREPDFPQMGLFARETKDYRRGVLGKISESSEANSDLDLSVPRNIPHLSPNFVEAMIFFMSKKITLRDLFSDVDDQCLEEIAEVLHGYCVVVRRIYERLERERPEVIDDILKNGRMNSKVDQSKNQN